MNKILRYSFIALLAMVFGNVSAQEFVFDFTDETNPWGFPTEQYKETGTFTKDGKSIVVTTTNYTRWFSDTKVLLFGKKDATLTLPAFDFDVERIDVVGASGASGKVTFNIFVGDDAVSTEVTGAKETATFDIAEGKQAAGTVYVIKNTNDNNNQISKILIWKKGTSGDTPQPKTTNVATVAELNALENGTAFTYTSDALVVYLNGAYAYIKDDTGSSLIYDSSKTKFANLGTGSRITANWTGKVSIYNNLFEAVPDDVLPTAGTSAVLVTYPDAAITDVVAANMNQVVVLKGVTYTAPDGKNFTITEGGVEVKGYNTFNIEIAAPEEGKTYNITGAISVYKENAQFLPIAIEEVTASTDTWTVAGTKPLVDNSWDPTDTNADMTSTDGVTYTYVKENITLEAGVPNEFKIVKNHSWDEAYPSQNYSFSVDETAKYKVTITFNATSKEITVDKVKTGEAEVVTHTYSVVGTLVGGWEADQDMTKGEDGLYKVEIKDVAKGDYEFKVRVDHDWSVSYPTSGNYQLSVEQTSSVTITFNEDTKDLLVSVTPATGINAINAAKAKNGAIYNVAGQKVNAGYKGLVIMNGKKFVNK